MANRTQVRDDKLIIVTGGAGFIGSCMLRHLNDLGFKNLVVVDQLDTSERWKNLVGKSISEFVSAPYLFDWLEGRHDDIQAFIHLGACSSTVEQDANFLIENNYRYTLALAEYALLHGHRFVYASSAATYGDGAQGFSDDHAQLEQLRPLNMYGLSKHLFDLWALRQGVLDQVVGLKYFNVFGPNEWHKGRMTSAILKMVPVAMQDGVIRLFKSSEPSLYADGEQKRDFLYVKDAVAMTYSFLESDIGGIFNVGSGIASTWNELAHGVIQALERPIRIEYMEMPQDLIGKYQNYTCADMSKFRGESTLNFSVRPLEEAVVDYVRNHLIPETYL